MDIVTFALCKKLAQNGGGTGGAVSEDVVRQINEVKQQVESVKQEVNTTKQQVETTQNKVSDVEQKMNANHVETTTKFNTVTSNLEKVENQLKTKVSAKVVG